MIRRILMENVGVVINDFTSIGDSQFEKVNRKKASFLKRDAKLLKVGATGKVHTIDKQLDDTEKVTYSVHYTYFIKHGNHYYLEEEVESRKAVYYGGVIYEDVEEPIPAMEPGVDEEEYEGGERLEYRYDRHAAVQYAEKWWNSYNPAYKKFENDCTNFISQCLLAGDAPMRGYPTKGKGWWMRNQSWSYSWTVAHSLRQYIPNSSVGLRGKLVESPDKLKLGDVICYDFEGDGRFDHTTIVTGRDADGMPLVNAHTYNCRMRYWNYEDSTAYTPNIKYKFLTIMDDR
ncbi:amidase domain-containing protein [Rossellomorea marisflavi]|uniref:Putative amidase domain-containing protein n=1 Tax=Rossellomorea marisflavi TaxID=189381 RepID=A0A163ITK8_9BACI|nr:hypothetical protein AV649_09555 [Rossellomorea marisflavi]